ncbi:sigma-54 interacting response regulator protein [Anopheles sinensis]|uniref:Sigma-54 interacting response regulator protein n=1 Tax=Anopheles sinensis TaxID=74873 RepID=A0A084WKB9_ANOSI|nr:sigma-54 interacting response regulator protein [Anopheles sinensis]
MKAKNEIEHDMCGGGLERLVLKSTTGHQKGRWDQIGHSVTICSPTVATSTCKDASKKLTSRMWPKVSRLLWVRRSKRTHGSEGAPDLAPPAKKTMIVSPAKLHAGSFAGIVCGFSNLLAASVVHQRGNCELENSEQCGRSKAFFSPKPCSMCSNRHEQLFCSH